MPAHDDAFDRIINKEFTMETPTEHTDPNPYGTPTHPHKAGLTKRGKAALGFGVAVIAGGSLIGYQVHENNQVKAQEIALKAEALELEKMREINRASQADKTAQASATTARQVSVDKCITGKEHLVGKGFGSPSYRDIVDTCQAQYTDTTGGSSGDMQAAAATESSGGGGVNDGLLIGGGVLVLFFVAAAKKGTQSNAA